MRYLTVSWPCPAAVLEAQLEKCELTPNWQKDDFLQASLACHGLERTAMRLSSRSSVQRCRLLLFRTAASLHHMALIPAAKPTHLPAWLGVRLLERTELWCVASCHAVCPAPTRPSCEARQAAAFLCPLAKWAISSTLVQTQPARSHACTTKYKAAIAWPPSAASSTSLS